MHYSSLNSCSYARGVQTCDVRKKLCGGPVSEFEVRLGKPSMYARTGLTQSYSRS
jgi:hypothetical protein